MIRLIRLMVLSALLAGGAGAQSAVEVVVPAGDHQLAGTLTLPATPGPHPAVILLSGSGAQNRDEESPVFPGYRPFALIAGELTRAGFAVLRYDDRGTAKSTGQFATASTADFANDARAVLAFLRGRGDIDPDRVGLLGHSEGALIAVMVAARDPEVAFVISLAGPAVRGYDVLVTQARRGLAVSSLPREEQQRLLREQREELDLLVRQDWPAIEALMVRGLREHFAKLPPEQRQQLGDLDAAVRAQTAQGLTAMRSWFHFFVTYHPAPDWAKVRAPILALFGKLDTQVDARQNGAALLAVLARGQSPDVTVRLFPQANHLFQKATTGSAEEYTTLPYSFVPELLPTLREWLRERFLTR